MHHLRLEGSLYCQSQLAGDRSLSMPVLPGKMMFHIVTAGRCWLTVDGQPPVELHKGSLAG
ncbi:cupin domain-containing protein [Thalassolituus marinus]|nr:cupin domain-containing protein [Thalassolituus marinus]